MLPVAVSLTPGGEASLLGLAHPLFWKGKYFLSTTIIIGLAGAELWSFSRQSRRCAASQPGCDSYKDWTRFASVSAISGQRSGPEAEKGAEIKPFLNPRNENDRDKKNRIFQPPAAANASVFTITTPDPQNHESQNHTDRIESTLNEL
jgi:hypothetical protein